MESVTKIANASPSGTKHTRHSATKDAHASVLEMVYSRLRRTGHAEFRHVTCEQDSGTLWLRGQLSSYYLKQLAQESLRHMDGVDRIVNAVEVV